MLNLSRSSDSDMGISMDGDAENFEALAETTVFLSYFKDLPDHRQAGKVAYPLDEILLLCLLAVLAGAEAFTDPVSAKRSSSCCASSVSIAMALPRMIIWAISSPPSTPGRSSAVSSPGSRR